MAVMDSDSSRSRSLGCSPFHDDPDSDSDSNSSSQELTLTDSDLIIDQRASDIQTMKASLSGPTPTGRKLFASKILPAMNRVTARDDWTNQTKFVSAMLRNGSAPLRSWGKVYKTQYQARWEMGYFERWNLKIAAAGVYC